MNIGGYYLTDNFTNLDKWRIPTGTSIPAGGYLTFWADEDSSQGTNHMNFNLSASGEFVYLLNASLALVDSVTFDTLPTDMSWVRSPNGTGPWVVKGATYGANNDGGTSTGITATSSNASTLTLFPNPARRGDAAHDRPCASGSSRHEWRTRVPRIRRWRSADFHRGVGAGRVHRALRQRSGKACGDAIGWGDFVVG